MSNNQLMNASEFTNRKDRAETGRLGKVVHDPRGNAIWDWTIETGVLARATVDELLGKLAGPVVLGLEHEVEGTPSWGGDPYNRCS